MAVAPDLERIAAWAMAAFCASWAVVRLFGLERGFPLVPLMAYTPYMVLLSGTVGAAMQGYFQGLPAVALSVEHDDEMNFDVAAKLGGLLARAIREASPAGGLFVSVNLPNLPLERIKGLEVTRLARRSYIDSIEEGHDGKRNYYWTFTEF